MKLIPDLFLTFAKVGVTTFGGGYAMLPVLQREVVESKGWATEEELADIYAIGQCTPGVIAVNVSTYIGYKKAHVPGAVAATFGVVFPSLVIIILITALIRNFSEIEWVRHALAGIRACVCALVFSSVIKLARKAIPDLAAFLVFAAVLILSLFTDVSNVVWVVAAGAAGVMIRTLSSLRKKKGGDGT
ncbi:MAG: chromate transporter [Oscillospiraceae bacterium]|nr:chromate transporter [Oscillospiraceae bacterium]